LDNVIESMHIMKRELIIKLTGSVATENYQQIQSTVEDKINQEDENFDSLVFDLDNVTYVSSAGLRMFSFFSQLMIENDKEYHLINLDPMLKKMFMLTGYASSYDIKEKEKE